MADVLRGLGYRVLPPSEEGGLHAFSVKPRFVREREEQRARQRQQQKEQREEREQRRRERPEKPNERQFFAAAPARDGQKRQGPAADRKDGPRPDRKDGPPRDDRRGPRPPRRDS